MTHYVTDIIAYNSDIIATWFADVCPDIVSPNIGYDPISCRKISGPISDTISQYTDIVYTWPDIGFWQGSRWPGLPHYWLGEQQYFQSFVSIFGKCVFRRQTKHKSDKQRWMLALLRSPSLRLGRQMLSPRRSLRQNLPRKFNIMMKKKATKNRWWWRCG